MSALRSLISYILPARCPVSGEIVEQQGMLSPTAWNSLHFISRPFCECCGLPLEITPGTQDGLLCGACITSPKAYRQARSAVVYDDASRKLILSFKHGDHTYMTLTFAPWLKTAGGAMLEDADYLVPVPLHWFRLVKRRYNQAALIADRLSAETRIPHLPDLLKRVRHTPTQGHMSARDRYKNVLHAFDLNPKYSAHVKDKKIILIDDVMTTGATIEECARILYAAGASRVDVLTVARVSRPDTIS